MNTYSRHRRAEPSAFDALAQMQSAAAAVFASTSARRSRHAFCARAFDDDFDRVFGPAHHVARHSEDTAGTEAH